MPASSFLALPPWGSSSVLLAKDPCLGWQPLPPKCPGSPGGQEAQTVRDGPPLFTLFPVCPHPRRSGKRAGSESCLSRAGGAGSPLLAVRWGSPGGSETTQNSEFCSRPSSGSQLGCWLRNPCSEAVSWHRVPRTRQSTKERGGHLGEVSGESRSKGG